MTGSTKNNEILNGLNPDNPQSMLCIHDPTFYQKHLNVPPNPFSHHSIIPAINLQSNNLAFPLSTSFEVILPTQPSTFLEYEGLVPSSKSDLADTIKNEKDPLDITSCHNIECKIENDFLPEASSPDEFPMLWSDGEDFPGDAEEQDPLALPEPKQEPVDFLPEPSEESEPEEQITSEFFIKDEPVTPSDFVHEMFYHCENLAMLLEEDANMLREEQTDSEHEMEILNVGQTLQMSVQGIQADTEQVQVCEVESSKKNNFTCRICNVTYNSSTQLRKHNFQSHRKVVEYPFLITGSKASNKKKNIEPPASACKVSNKPVNSRFISAAGVHQKSSSELPMSSQEISNISRPQEENPIQFGTGCISKSFSADGNVTNTRNVNDQEESSCTTPAPTFCGLCDRTLSSIDALKWHNFTVHKIRRKKETPSQTQAAVDNASSGPDLSFLSPAGTSSRPEEPSNAVKHDTSSTLLCRICALPGPEMVHIFSYDGHELKLPSLIAQYLPLKAKVYKEELLPLSQSVCLPCRQILTNYAKLRETSLRSKVILRAKLLKQKPVKTAAMTTSVTKEFLDVSELPRYYACQIPGCRWSTDSSRLSSVAQHYKTTHDGLDMCLYCFRLFPDAAVTKQHVEQLHMIPCVVCGHKCLGFRQLHLHCTQLHRVWSNVSVTNTHVEVQIFTCKECGAKFADRKVFDDHQKNLNQILTERCALGEEKCLGHVLRKLQKHFGLDEKPVHNSAPVTEVPPLLISVCDECGAQFPEKCELSNHQIRMKHILFEACISCKYNCVGNPKLHEHCTTQWTFKI